MKQKFGFIITLTLLFALIIPFSSASAYTGGVLNGRELPYGTGYNTDGKTTFVTDNNESTTFTLEPGKQLWYEFKSPVKLIAYQLKAISGDTSKIGMSYSRYSGGGYGYFGVLNTDGTKTFGNSYNDVHWFRLYNAGSTAVVISEFDLFIDGEYSELAPPLDLKGEGSDSKVKLDWTLNGQAQSYNVYRSVTEGGPYSKIGSVTSSTYEDISVTNGTKYYYVVTSVNQSGETGYSNEISVTPSKTVADPQPAPSGDRAILTITMTTGIAKEYDLSIEEVQAFLDWYDARDNGSGPAKYAINKHNNNKGPFIKRTEYVIFDKILTFEVSEYTAE